MGDNADDLSEVPAEFAADARFVKLGVNEGDSAFSLRVNVVLVRAVSTGANPPNINSRAEATYGAGDGGFCDCEG